jgi:DNA-binding transcriptional ArsR family regulator
LTTGGRSIIVNQVVHHQFAALGDPTRLAFVERLARGPASVGELAASTAMSLPAVLKHLRVLEEAGLVSRPPGPQPRAVRLEAAALDLMDTWIERYRRRAEQRYRRLDAVLAAMNEPASNGAEHDHDQGDRHRG